MFPEGGLTRDGKLRTPKFGLLAYMVGRFDPDHARDVVFVPVGINYDRVIEDRNLTAATAEQAGAPYAQRGAFAFTAYVARALALAVAGRWYRNGYASVSFGTPISLRAYTREHGVDFRKLPEEARFRAIEALGRTLMTQVGKVVPVLPVSLVATVFERAGGRALSEIEVKSATVDLVDQLRTRGVHIHVPRQDRDYATEVERRRPSIPPEWNPRRLTQSGRYSPEGMHTRAGAQRGRSRVPGDRSDEAQQHNGGDGGPEPGGVNERFVHVASVPPDRRIET